MKKILLPFILLFISIQLNAQSLVLTQAFNEPVVSDDEMKYNIDTSAYTTGLPISVTGSTCVWNYTNLKALNPVFINQYLPPSSATNSASFPGCTLVGQDVFFTLFLKSSTTPTTQTEIVGLSSSTIAVSFTNSAVIAKYPISYPSSQTDNAAGTFTGLGFNGQCSGSSSTAADGIGTLNLPGNMTYTNVLRVKNVLSLNFNSGFIPLGSAKETSYNYYHSSNKFPLLTVTYLSFATTGSTPTVTSFITGNTNYFVVGVKENVLDASNLSVYPNPFTGSLQLDVRGQLHPQQIKLYSPLGQLVYDDKYTAALDLKHLQSGIYTVEVKTDQGIIRKKLVRE